MLHTVGAQYSALVLGTVVVRKRIRLSGLFTYRERLKAVLHLLQHTSEGESKEGKGEWRSVSSVVLWAGVSFTRLCVLPVVFPSPTAGRYFRVLARSPGSSLRPLDLNPGSSTY